MNRLVMMILRNLPKLPGAYIKLCRYARHTQRYPEMEKYRHIQRIMSWAIEKGNVELQVFGRENIPSENGYMLYGNHQGMFDAVAIAADFPGPLAAVFKQELKDVPLLKQIVACTNSFAMDRQDVRQSLTVINAVAEEIKKGRNYLIFPEGTRSKTGNQMGDFHSGSFKAAMKAKCPILPIVFVDSFRVLDQKGSAPLSVQLHYLRPIPYEEYRELNTVALAALVKARIQETLDQYV
ncbi:MAG: 1-acyl-sn-glycerol-3-phosphate acyltransferase [Oscillospiraceae bacterium]|nr:1-acyl-sn-glycerol-3-phosphate acyltransferase [Oscillospiraceae bacterium]